MCEEASLERARAVSVFELHGVAADQFISKLLTESELADEADAVDKVRKRGVRFNQLSERTTDRSFLRQFHFRDHRFSHLTAIFCLLPGARIGNHPAE